MPLGVCPPFDEVDCGTGCLYNVVEDLGEHEDLASSQPEKLDELRGHLHRLVPGVYDPDRGDPGLKPCEAAVRAGGYWAPYLP